jgi:branched-chain amino acid transport system ATP-binding protein
MSDTVLQVQKLSKHFSGLAAVDEVSLEVRSAQLHAVIGPNGAGKTTLISLLSGELPASSGAIWFRGSEISRATPAPRALHWLRDARSYEDIAARASQALEAVNLANRRDQLALALSHGEQRQLEIAMCLATSPQLLLLDEPLAGMGAEESAKMIELIGKLAESHAVLLVEHDMDAVFQLAGILTVMANGRVLATGAPAEVRANREVQIAYLGAAESSPR